jgi:HYR domain
MKRLTRTLPLALALLLATPWSALADNLVADGDGVAPIATSQLNYGDVCLGHATDAVVAVAVRAASHPGPKNAVYASSSPVVGAVESVNVPQLSATITADTVWTPADWQTAPNSALAGTFSATVTLTPDALGKFSGRVRFRADGVNGHNGHALTRYVNLQVRAKVVDCDGPVLSLPADQVVEAADSAGSVVTFASATATDAVDGPRPVVCDAVSGSTFPLGDTTVTCSSSDKAGNLSSGQFAVSVVDTTAPTLSGVPGDQILEATGPAGADVTFTDPTATDSVDGSLPVTCDLPSGSTFPLGDTTVTCTATDNSGNSSSADFTVSVTEPATDPDPEPAAGSAPSDPPSADPAPSPTHEPEQMVSDATSQPAQGTSGSSSLPDTRLSDPAGSEPISLLGIGILLVAGAIVGARKRFPQTAGSRDGTAHC